ncbi:MAG: aminodeoxychorismate/anthranilate synthase component II [Phycisphaeraceae bacterium]|nr:MAG: aminodeoxychorismate/anthranilate synthase component II [Phycisphaeraceae bacterium]
MILLLDNYDSFTWNLVQRIGELDPALDIEVVRNDLITPDAAEAMGPSHVIISPGPCTPLEAGVSNDIISRFAGRIPVLGVCLGHQCIGFSHGMTVTRHSRLMHGKTSMIHHDGRGIYAGLSNPFIATRYHSLVVLRDTVPAEGWEVSAWTTDTFEDGVTAEVVMGLRRVWGQSEGPAPLDGVQFHPESFLTVEGPRMLANFLGLSVGAMTAA